MAVLKNERGESKMEFLYNARQLQIYTIKQCTRFPKRYTFFLAQPIVQLSVQIYNNVKCGNSIYPINLYEVQMRRDYFLKARAKLYNLISQLEIAQEMFGIDAKHMEEWDKYIFDEIKLIDGILKSDKTRYKNIES